MCVSEGNPLQINIYDITVNSSRLPVEIRSHTFVAEQILVQAGKKNLNKQTNQQKTKPKSPTLL